MGAASASRAVSLSAADFGMTPMRHGRLERLPGADERAARPAGVSEDLQAEAPALAVATSCSQTTGRPTRERAPLPSAQRAGARPQGVGGARPSRAPPEFVPWSNS